MGYMYLKKKRKKNIKNKIIFVIIFIVILSYFIGLNISKYIITSSKTIIEEKIITMINKTINTDIINKLNDTNLISIKEENEEIKSIDYNTLIINLYVEEITNNIEKELKNLSNSKIKIPIGLITNNPLFNTIGLNINIMIKEIGTVVVSSDIEIEEYNINSALIKLYLKINIKEQILLPLVSDKITIKTEMPISYKIVNGKIPEYYGKTINKN